MTLMAKVNGVTYTMGLSSLVELPGGRTIEPQVRNCLLWVPWRYEAQEVTEWKFLRAESQSAK